MSTPIVRFDKDGSGFSLDNIGFGALKLYLAVSLPLVILTFIAYWIFTLVERRKLRQRLQRKQVEEKNAV